MWFDARAALESIGGGARTGAEREQFAEFAEFATPQRPKLVPMTDGARRRAAALPTNPPTCAACGVADWHVSLTDTDRRKLHVACWRAEQEGEA
jgi:hypothetical protein